MNNIDNPIQQVPPVQPTPENQTFSNNPITNQKGNFLIILGVIFIILVVGGGAYYFGVNKNKTISQNDPSSPSLSDTWKDDGDQKPTLTPTNETTSITQKPKPTSQSISIPSNWKEYTAEDPDFGIRTTMSMPPDYSFRFTGSEFTIQNDSDATELWDYSTSVYRDNDGVLKNHYTGGSRRVWYEKYLAMKQSALQYKDKILTVSEIPINATSYLAITVETPAYNDRGVISGTKTGVHYVYVQNNIVYIITPASNKAYTAEAQIPKYIGIIFTSLTSNQTK